MLNPNTRQALIISENRTITVAKSQLSNTVWVDTETREAYFYNQLKFEDE
jgi:hypothetical protein